MTVLLITASTQAQQPAKVPRIAYVVGPGSAGSARYDAFRQGLRELGYEDGKNIAIDFRSNEGNRDRQRAIMTELVRSKVDVIVAVGAGDIRIAKEATTTIPIVMIQGGDPVGSGFVASLARPGGNITGLATLRPELSGKRLELLKDIVPKLTRVALFASSASPDYAQVLKEAELAAGSLELKLQSHDIRSAKDFETAFQAALRGKSEAVVVRVRGPILSPHRKEFSDLAVKSRLPSIYEGVEEVEAGGLMSYGVNFTDLYRRAAIYVDKILKGRKPEDLPVEQPTKFNFVVNMKAAKQIGLTIPPNVLARAFESILRSECKKISCLVLVALLFALCASADAQQPNKIPRIAYVSAASRSPMSDRSEAFRRGLRELGYVEGKNIVIEWRFGDARADRIPAFLAELIRLKVDVIVSAGSGVTRHAKEATVTVPIVMAADFDPVNNGFVASLARPGGNITGLATLRPEISGKLLELLKEIIPKLSRAAFFGTSNNPGNAEALKESEVAAAAFGVKLQYVDVLSPKDIESAFRAAVRERAEAGLWQVQGSVSSSQRKEIAELAVKSRLPIMYYGPNFVEAGGLMSYGVSLPDLDRRAAYYVDKILKGAKPADLPVEQPTKFEFIVNLKTAKQIGLTIPPNVLARADKVIR